MSGENDNGNSCVWCSGAQALGADAQTALAGMYVTGRGVRRRTAEAVKWYRKAAEQGDATAQFTLGSMYVRGSGVRENYAEAAKLYRRAAEQGHVLE